jgi:hypothetical protein
MIWVVGFAKMGLHITANRHSKPKACIEDYNSKIHVGGRLNFALDIMWDGSFSTCGRQNFMSCFSRQGVENV